MLAVLGDSLFLSEKVFFGLLAVLVVLVGIMVVRAWKRARLTPAERERHRRMAIASTGKMGDATLTEIRGDLLFYSYDVRGVEYTASQDVSTLRAYMPEDYSFAVAPIFVKYNAKNPADSIVLAENWSGLRSSAPNYNSPR